MEEFRICKGCGKSKPNNSIYFEERLSKSGKLYTLSTCRMCYNLTKRENSKINYHAKKACVDNPELKIFLTENEQLREELIKRKAKLFEEYNNVYIEIKELNKLIKSEIAKSHTKKRKTTLVRKPKKDKVEKLEETVEPAKVVITSEDRLKYGKIIKQLEKINNKGKL